MADSATTPLPTNFFEELQWRGLVADCTDLAALKTRLASGHITLYCGFDPTADSLHVGSLVPLLALRRFQLAGHVPIPVAGGATGSIGDPSGKTQERQLLDAERIAANIAAVRVQLARWLDFDTAENRAMLLDNADWICPMGIVDFLRDVGKHFTVNQMVARESVRARMEDREAGISYTEFSYMLLQAYDFFWLAKEHGCELQIGGSDQWGNIVAGLDLIRKKLQRPAFGLTLPLITKSDGTKFGKTESGTVWLDVKRTSVYRFYQFWLNTDDRDVLPYLRIFTFLTPAEIVELDAGHAANPGGRAAHRALARALTALVHGEDAAADAIRASEILFGGALDGISEAAFAEIAGEVPAATIPRTGLEGAGMPLVELLVHSGLCPSKGQARKDIEGGGVYLNNQRAADVARAVGGGDLLFAKHLLLRKGKKNYVLVTTQAD